MPERDDVQQRWTSRRWLGLIVLCFLAQLILIVLLGERRVPALTAMPFKTGVHLIADPWSLEQLSAFSDMSDPSLFALPSLEGFSRAGWLTFTPEAEDFAEPAEEPTWLELNPERLGAEFAAYVASNAVAPVRMVDESMPEIAGIYPRTSAELEFPASTLLLRGALAQRKLLTPLELPSWSHTDVLTNSVVRILVDADGVTLSSALVSSSGLKEADNHALKISRRLRFKPLGDRERHARLMVSGTLEFVWRTVAADKPIDTTAAALPAAP